MLLKLERSKDVKNNYHQIAINYFHLSRDFQLTNLGNYQSVSDVLTTPCIRSKCNQLSTCSWLKSVSENKPEVGLQQRDRVIVSHSQNHYFRAIFCTFKKFIYYLTTIKSMMRIIKNVNQPILNIKNHLFKAETCSTFHLTKQANVTEEKNEKILLNVIIQNICFPKRKIGKSYKFIFILGNHIIAKSAIHRHVQNLK